MPLSSNSDFKKEGESFQKLCPKIFFDLMKPGDLGLLICLRIARAKEKNVKIHHFFNLDFALLSNSYRHKRCSRDRGTTGMSQTYFVNQIKGEVGEWGVGWAEYAHHNRGVHTLCKDAVSFSNPGGQAVM